MRVFVSYRTTQGQIQMERPGVQTSFLLMYFFMSDLFHNSCSADHCLNHLYTANRKPAGSMQLRHRGHNFALPTIHLEFNKRHFVARVLFDYV